MRPIQPVLLLSMALILLFPAMTVAGPGSGIEGTAHDFSTKGQGEGACLFCHTPHQVNSTVLRWNHTLSRSTFSWDTASTTVGTAFPTFKGDTYRGPSAKCLGCHDGTVAVGSITWLEGGSSSYQMDATRLVWPSGSNVGAARGMPGSMAGNHPVAMPYPYGGRNTYNGVTTGSQVRLSEWQADPQTLNIRLYTDGGGDLISPGASALKTGIECSSCHDPHNRYSVEAKFLRGNLSGSGTEYLCRKCHNK